MTDLKEAYKMRWMQRDLTVPDSGDWYEPTSGSRIYYELGELVEHCKLRNTTWKGGMIHWVGVYPLVEGKPDKNGRTTLSAGKMLREIHPAEFDTI